MKEGYAERLQNSLKVFKLNDVYNSHKDYVLDFWGKRSLSKLTHDIDEEISRMKEEV